MHRLTLPTGYALASITCEPTAHGSDRPGYECGSSPFGTADYLDTPEQCSDHAASFLADAFGMPTVTLSLFGPAGFTYHLTLTRTGA